MQDPGNLFLEVHEFFVIDSGYDVFGRFNFIKSFGHRTNQVNAYFFTFYIYNPKYIGSFIFFLTA